MVLEVDTPPQPNTFRRMVWVTVTGLALFRAKWGRRLVGGAIGLIGDALNEGATQAFYARLPGHPQQAPDSLTQSANDRGLFRFRGESIATFAARVAAAWDDYAQAGTSIQLLKVVNQWGVAGWPASWDESLITCVESGDPAVWTFTLTIGFGAISPDWDPWVVGAGHVIGELGLFVGAAEGIDFQTLIFLVNKWKRSASVGYVKMYYSVSAFVVFTVR